MEDRGGAWSQGVPEAGRGPGIDCPPRPPEGTALPTLDLRLLASRAVGVSAVYAIQGAGIWYGHPGTEYRGHLGQGGGGSLTP